MTEQNKKASVPSINLSVYIHSCMTVYRSLFFATSISFQQHDHRASAITAVKWVHKNHDYFFLSLGCCFAFRLFKSPVVHTFACNLDELCLFLASLKVILKVRVVRLIPEKSMLPPEEGIVISCGWGILYQTSRQNSNYRTIDPSEILLS